MKELIKLAKEKGFESVLFEYLNAVYDTDCVSQETTLNTVPFLKFIWMCELQKWLRDEKKIYVFAKPFYSRTKNEFEASMFRYIISRGVELLKHAGGFSSYDRTLESGLTEALKLI